MRMPSTRCLVALGFAITAALAVSVLGQAPALAPADSEVQVDRIFSRWTESTPGCAVGVAAGGRPVLSKAYGMADLEREAKNTPDTIFEAGSVSKQFTAAAVLLLARESKLSLDDPVRKYIPELHDFGAPLTVRHMLNHTSGLRDWGSLAGIGGWPRTSRVHTHAHVVEILSRQRALNFPSGTRYSYSNSGYNLAAVLVSRVSGLPFAEFTKTRLFDPLGMTRTSWRDDHTRIVKHRAIAYSDRQGTFAIAMPFENVHGNGGLLSTVGDLLKWNENFTTPKVGNAAFVAEQQQPGRFNDGRTHDYALGLRVGTYKGVRQVDHSGSTAGYRAHLARYPDQRVSVAVLCNVSTGAATEYARAVADIYLADRLAPTTLKAEYALTDAEAARLAGLYRDTLRGTPVTITRDKNGLRAGRTALVAMSPTRFITSSGQRWEFDPSTFRQAQGRPEQSRGATSSGSPRAESRSDGRGGVRITDAAGTVDVLERVEPAKPTVEQLKALAGTYRSDEAETTLVVAMENDALVVKRRPDTVGRLTPIYADAFSSDPFDLIIFRRDPAGRVTALSVIEERVWDLRFRRESPATVTSQD